ncbi:MAG: TetR/AcrR family transcriptional regulator [Acidimicrobiia bacterium]
MSPRGEAGRGRERLSEESIVATALELIDREGVEAVTMRRLAEGLGVQPMAFYHHFGNKNALLDRVADEILAGIELPPRDLDWDAWTRQFLNRTKDALLSYPNRVDLLLSRPGSGGDYANMFGAFVGTLARQGIDAGLIHTAWHLLISYLLGYLQQFHALVRTLGRPGRPPEGPAQNLALIASQIETCDEEREFEAGLDLIIGAIQDRIELPLRA